jgi:hypothetical protein
MEVSEIVARWLEENGYDGLVDQDSECGCQISDLMPCEMPCQTCRAGHKRESDECGFLIFPGKSTKGADNAKTT